MYADTLTLDQLRVLVAIADAGTFSAAGKRLRRSQGAVSYQVAAMESALELRLFDRSSRRPRPTPAGEAIAREARRLLARADDLKAMARSLRDGLEPKLSLAVDALFPMDVLSRALRRFRERHPQIPIELRSGVRSAVSRDVAQDGFDVGIVGPTDDLDERLVLGPELRTVTLVAVVSRSHPLAQPGPVPRLELADHVHVVMRERGGDTTLSLASPGDAARIWRVSDADIRMQLVDAGLGWSRVPLHAVADKLAAGDLVALDLTPLPSRVKVPLFVVHRREHPPGPAARWLFEQLRAPEERREPE